jgi:hypothetical protein
MKDMGQGGAVHRSAAVVYGVSDALRGSGAEVHNLPLTPERILDAATAVLRGAR